MQLVDPKGLGILPYYQSLDLCNFFTVHEIIEELWDFIEKMYAAGGFCRGPQGSWAGFAIDITVRNGCA